MKDWFQELFPNGYRFPDDLIKKQGLENHPIIIEGNKWEKAIKDNTNLIKASFKKQGINIDNAPDDFCLWVGRTRINK